MTEEEDIMSIPEFFKGKSIFITGGSGFMGKVLIEKILRSCPDVSKIYVLVRSKKGKSPEERIQEIINVPLFDTLIQEHPENLKKIIPIPGDVSEIRLGISDQSKQQLIDEVNIIYHAAASVRFDDSLKNAILMNTRSTREVVYLAQEMKHLEILVHFSTAYSQTDKDVIEEKMYPPSTSWKDAIMLAENADPFTLDILTQHYMNPLPNTYTYTKNLAEQVVQDLCEGKIPTIIMRPSIVISTLKDPVAGWIDNFNGPVGILVAGGKGILRSVYTLPDITADYVPVDLVIRGLLVGTWHKGLEKNREEKFKVSVYNASNNDINNVTLKEMVEMGRKLAWDIPLNNILWYPGGDVTSCYPNHFLKVIFFHILPALLVDGLLKITGHKPMLLKIQRKIYIANMSLRYFVTREWKIINNKGILLEHQLLSSDRRAFRFNHDDYDPFEYFKNAVIGTRKYLLKEDLSSFEDAKKHTKRMYVLFLFFNTLCYMGVFYLLFYKIDVIGLLMGGLNQIYLYFNSL